MRHELVGSGQPLAVIIPDKRTGSGCARALADNREPALQGAIQFLGRKALTVFHDADRSRTGTHGVSVAGLLKIAFNRLKTYVIAPLRGRVVHNC